MYFINVFVLMLLNFGIQELILATGYGSTSRIPVLINFDYKMKSDLIT
jgi:hypothetical protein